MLAVTLCVVALTASGCVRVHASLTVSSDDLVSGDVIAAATPTSAEDRGPVLSVPANLAADATARPYQADGYVGTDLSFHGLTFARFAALVAGNNGAGHYQLALHRSGDLVTLTGSVDLSEVPAGQSDTRITIELPGNILNSDGTVSSADSTGSDASTVTWAPAAGRVSTLSATAQYTAGRSYPASFWAGVMIAACLLIAVFLAVLALLARRRHLRGEERAYS